MEVFKIILILMMSIVEIGLLSNYIIFRFKTIQKSNIIIWINRSKHQSSIELFTDIALALQGIIWVVFLILNKDFGGNNMLLLMIFLLTHVNYIAYGNGFGLCITEEGMQFRLRTFNWNKINKIEWKNSKGLEWLHIKCPRRIGFKIQIEAGKKEALRKVLLEHC